MFKLIEGPYLDDILAQPNALDNTVAGLPDHVPSVLGDVQGSRFGRIVLTGMGSSFHALYPLHLHLTSLGLPSFHVETAELCQSMPALLAGKVLVIAVSQSGRSAEIVTLLSLLSGGTRLLAVTNDPDAPLANHADSVVLTRAGVEATVSCKTYVSTLAALEWVGAAVAGDLDATRHDLARAGSAVAAYLDDYRGHIETMASQIEGVRQTYFAGRGRSLAAALTGGLITKEATRCPAEGMSTAAFRHGPFEVLGPDVFLAVLAGDAPVRALNDRLLRDARAVEGRAFSIGPESDDAAFCLPVAPARLLPILEILPIQLLSISMTAAAGEEGGVFRLASKVTIIA